ncbi:MAG: hypothetical protein RL163_870, partial [Pseudomonadota bacterium]
LLPARSVQTATLTTEFKSPVMLPAQLAVWQHETSSGLRWEVRDAHAERTHVRALLAL